MGKIQQETKTEYGSKFFDQELSIFFEAQTKILDKAMFWSFVIGIVTGTVFGIIITKLTFSIMDKL